MWNQRNSDKVDEIKTYHAHVGIHSLLLSNLTFPMYFCQRGKMCKHISRGCHLLPTLHKSLTKLSVAKQ